ncbi:MAG: HD domain-containing protein [Bacilli bacterium]
MKEKYINLLKSTKRENIESLISYLENETDFFKAPASSRFHGNYEGGLLEHSLNVYTRLSLLNKIEEKKLSEESIIISSLLHDICKVNMYVVELRNTKNECGEWIKVPFFKAFDKSPYGHGEKSVREIEKFIKISEEEAYAIRWHMGAFEGERFYNLIDSVYTSNLLALLLHHADVYASKRMEKTV